MYNRKRANNGSIESVIPQNANSITNALNFYTGAANPSIINYNGDLQFSDYFLEDASFLRCDNISIGYKIPNFIEKASLRFSGSVNNLFLITKYSGQDPENISGIDNKFYPRPRVYSFGLTLNF